MFYRFSGITEEDLEDVTTSIRDVQAVLLSLFTDKTILLGHSLESDLNALKVSAGLEIIKRFSCSTQLSMKFIMLIHAKMPTIVGILTFISMIDTMSERCKARKIFIFQCFSFYEQLIFHAQLS